MKQIISWLKKPEFFEQSPNVVWLIDCVFGLLGITLVLSGLIMGLQQRTTPVGISNATWLLLLTGVTIIALASLTVAILVTYYRGKNR